MVASNNRDQNQPQPGDRLAYFGRVSSPKQKLEHHWEPVERWLQQSGMEIPIDMRFEDKIRRHESAVFFQDWDKRREVTSRKKYRFDELMQLVETGLIDWILVSSFDRWGIRNRDEIFVFRAKLKEYNVQIFSVIDQLNITGCDESSFWRVAAAAEAATRYVSSMADRNIQKMVSMVESGWATTGNNPFGIDLVLYSLQDMSRPLLRVIRTRFKDPHEYRIIYYNEKSKVERNINGIITHSNLFIERDVVSNGMPLRDKKSTGYTAEDQCHARRARFLKFGMV